MSYKKIPLLGIIFFVISIWYALPLSAEGVEPFRLGIKPGYNYEGKTDWHYQTAYFKNGSRKPETEKVNFTGEYFHQTIAAENQGDETAAVRFYDKVN
jgi:hypothetical protein